MDLKNIDDVRCLMSVRPSHNHQPIIGDDASIAHHHRRLRSSYEDIGKKWAFLSFLCAMGTVVSCEQLSCTLLEKDIKDDVPIERYLSSKSEIISDDALAGCSRGHFWWSWWKISHNRDIIFYIFLEQTARKHFRRNYSAHNTHKTMKIHTFPDIFVWWS